MTWNHCHDIRVCEKQTSIYHGGKREREMGERENWGREGEGVERERERRKQREKEERKRKIKKQHKICIIENGLVKSIQVV